MKLGHTVKLMPPRYVKAYVRRQKNDAADAAAICEAVSRPSMRFVPVKTVEQQAALMQGGTISIAVKDFLKTLWKKDASLATQLSPPNESDS